MSTRVRILHLPTSMDTRTCTRWACLQRIPGTGPDPTVLSRHVEQAVHHVAATVIKDAEVNGALQATNHLGSSSTATGQGFLPSWVPSTRRRTC